MEWLQQNWFWVVIAVFFVAVHFFGHGGHGGGCGGGHDHSRNREPEKESDDTKRPAGHQH